MKSILSEESCFLKSIYVSDVLGCYVSNFLPLSFNFLWIDIFVLILNCEIKLLQSKNDNAPHIPAIIFDNKIQLQKKFVICTFLNSLFDWVNVKFSCALLPLLNESLFLEHRYNNHPPDRGKKKNYRNCEDLKFHI